MTLFLLVRLLSLLSSRTRKLLWAVLSGGLDLRIPSSYCHSGCDAVNVPMFTPAMFLAWLRHDSTAHTHFFTPYPTGCITIILLRWSSFRYSPSLRIIKCNVIIFLISMIHGSRKPYERKWVFHKMIQRKSMKSSAHEGIEIQRKKVENFHHRPRSRPDPSQGFAVTSKSRDRLS